MKTYICIDPASRSLGLALVQDGKITKSVTIVENSDCIAVRCKNISEKIMQLDLPPLDAIYIEVLNNRTHRRTLWGVGAILTGLGKFCTDNTKVADNTVRNKEGKCILTPGFWKKYFGVASYRANDKDKNDKILAAGKRAFPEMVVESADEVVALFLANIIINEGE